MGARLAAGLPGLFGLFGLFGFEADFDFPFAFPFELGFDFEPAGQGPIVSPWRKCAGTAFWLTVIVTNGFVFEPVRWQIVTFFAVVVVVVVVGVVVLVLVEVVVVVGTVVVVVEEVDVVVGVVVEVVLDVELVEVEVDVDVDVLEVVDVLDVVEVVVCCWDATTVGPRTPRAAATPSPLRSASAASVATKRAVRRGRGFTGVPPGVSRGVSLPEMPPKHETCAALPANHSFRTPRRSCTRTSSRARPRASGCRRSTSGSECPSFLAGAEARAARAPSASGPCGRT